VVRKIYAKWRRTKFGDMVFGHIGCSATLTKTRRIILKQYISTTTYSIWIPLKLHLKALSEISNLVFLKASGRQLLTTACLDPRCRSA